jgi:hypothetical protein
VSGSGAAQSMLRPGVMAGENLGLEFRQEPLGQWACFCRTLGAYACSTVAKPHKTLCGARGLSARSAAAAAQNPKPSAGVRLPLSEVWFNGRTPGSAWTATPALALAELGCEPESFQITDWVAVRLVRWLGDQCAFMYAGLGFVPECRVCWTQ